MPIKPNIKESVSIVKGRAAKKKLPEPLVGWARPDTMLWMCDAGTQLVLFYNRSVDEFHVPAALCPLPRLPRKGERVECRFVPAKKGTRRGK